MDYFVGDYHYGHYNIIKYCNRPFRSVEEMDEHLLHQTNSIVKSDDRLWFLGDFCFGPRDYNAFLKRAEYYRNKINCNDVILIWGNHDPDLFSDRKDERKCAEAFANLFSRNYHLYIKKMHGYDFSLCHYAMARWNKSHRAAINLYGHSHSGIEEWMEKIMPNRKSIDVGVDNAAKVLGEYRPFALTEIVNIVGQKTGFLEHH